MSMHKCPVCGFSELEEAPRNAKNEASYEICPSCGFQFGVSDDDEGVTYEHWRSKWIEAGMKWSSRGMSPPTDWNPQQQLRF